MTLVIAGYNHSESMDFSSVWGNSSSIQSRTSNINVNGFFIAADSAISSNNESKTLLNGFQKIYPIEVKLWKPYFTHDGVFSDYLDVYETSPLFIAFAGSTLTAQHILNSITEHLSKLRISYTRNDDTGIIGYNIIRHCQTNPLLSNSVWDDDTFLDRDFIGLLTGEVIADVIEYSINDALCSASSYKLTEKDCNEMKTELVAGFWCQSCNRHEVYVYRMLAKAREDGGFVAYTEKYLLPEHEVAVLGMRQRFESDAQKIFSATLSSCIPPADVMYKFLNESIDIVQNSDSKGIAKPSFLTKFNRGDITTRKTK